MRNKLQMRTLTMAVAAALCFGGCGAKQPATEAKSTVMVASEKNESEAVVSEEVVSEEAVSEEVVSEENFSFEDDLGRSVTLKSVNRVAVLNASYGEMWALAGGLDTLVGASSNTWTDANITLSDSVLDLGEAHKISFEKLISCEPDLVLASADIDEDVEQMQAYEEAGLQVAYFSITDYNDYLRVLKLCTELTGCPEQYEINGTSMEKKVKEAMDKVKGEAPKVLYVRATTSGVKAKNSKGTVLGKMLSDLGCVNIADVEESLLEDLSMEVILEKEPDFIFAVYMGKDTDKINEQMEQALFSNGAWSTLSAVKNNHYYLMESSLYNLKPNARWGEAYEKLADILYGEE